MRRFQFHVLTVKPPHNENRDEDGRPKTAAFGGVTRGRVSSQAKKRALRYMPHFPENQRAIRTREAGVMTFEELLEADIGEPDAIRAAIAVNLGLGAGKGAAQVSGVQPNTEGVNKVVAEAEDKAKKATKGELDEDDERIGFALPYKEARKRALLRQLRSGQGLVVSTRELKGLEARIEELKRAKQEDSDGFARTLDRWLEEVRQGLLSPRDRDQDTALFGRMVADKPEFNVEAACAVSHAITTHAFAVEGDYFSAGEELNRLQETGAAITGYAFFGSGVYYQHATCNLPILYRNLEEGKGRTPEAVNALAHEAVDLLLKGLVFAQPAGKRNSCAHDTAASYLIVDAGDDPSFNLLLAYLKPVAPDGEDLMSASARTLKGCYLAARRSYGFTADYTIGNFWPGARKGNQPLPDEVWTYEELRTWVMARVVRPAL